MAGRPAAPGELALVQAFVNTLDIDAGREELHDPVSLRGWLADRGLIEPEAAVSGAGLRRAVALREALRALLAANHDADTTPPAEALAALNAVAERAPLRLRVHATGAGTLEPACSGVDGALARLLAAVYAAMADGSWRRLKICRAARCRWAFYDASKNRSGAWCAMQVCGNRTKVRAYQRRRRADAAAQPPSAHGA